MKPLKISNVHQSSGFTLLELLVVIVIAAVLAGIAAPGWFAFVNRQRIATVNSNLAATLGKLQSEAQQRRTSIRVWFDVNATDAPQIRSNSTLKIPDDTFEKSSIQPLGGNDIPAGTIRLRAFRGFDATGTAQDNWEAVTTTAGSCDSIDKACVALDFSGNPGRDRVPFKVEVYETSSPNGSSRKCVILPTLLGQIKTEQGSGCDVSPKKIFAN